MCVCMYVCMYAYIYIYTHKHTYRTLPRSTLTDACDTLEYSGHSAAVVIRALISLLKSSVLLGGCYSW